MKEYDNKKESIMESNQGKIKTYLSFIILFPVILFLTTLSSSCGSGDKTPLTYEDSLKVKMKIIEMSEKELGKAEDQIKLIDKFEHEAEIRYEDIKKRKDEIDQMLKEYESDQ